MGSLYDLIKQSEEQKKRVKPVTPITSAPRSLYTPLSIKNLTSLPAGPTKAEANASRVAFDTQRGVSISQGTEDPVEKARRGMSKIPVIGQFLTGTGPQGPSNSLYSPDSTPQNLVEKGIIGFLSEGFLKRLTPTRAEVGEQIFNRYEKLADVEPDEQRRLNLAVQDVVNRSISKAPAPGSRAEKYAPKNNLTDLKGTGVVLSEKEKDALFWTNMIEDAFAVLDAPVFVGSTKIPKNALLTALKEIKTADEVVPRLRMIGFSEEVAQEVAPKIAKSTNEIQIARYIKEAEDVAKGTPAAPTQSLFNRVKESLAKKTPDDSIIDEIVPPVKKVPDEVVTPPSSVIKRADEATPNTAERFFRSSEGGSKFDEINADDAIPAPIKKDLDTFVVKDGDGFIVVEGRTGRQIGDPGTTVAEAVKNAKTEVANMGDERLKEFVDNSPLSPRYAQVAQELPKAPEKLPTNLPKGVITADKLPPKSSPESSDSLKKAERPNKKMMQRVKEAKSFDDFYKKSGLTKEALDATARNKGFKDAEDLYQDYKKIDERVTKYQKAVKDDHAVLDDELSGLRNQIKELGTKRSADVASDLDKLEMEISLFEDFAGALPGKELVKFVSKKEGQFLDLKDPSKAKNAAERDRITDRNQKVLTAAEKAFEGTPLSDRFDDPDLIREAIEEYLDYSKKRKGLQQSIKETRASLRQKKRMDLLEQVVLQNRNNAKLALDELTDNEIFNLDPVRFQEYMVGYLDKREAHRQARIALQSTINEKELVKWENARKALKMPSTFEKMTVDQMNTLNKYLEDFETGDVFLGPRTIQTLKNTDLSGIATRREAVEKIVEQLNRARDLEGKPHVSVADVKNIQPSELWNFMAADSLQRQNPLFEAMIHDMYKADIGSGMAVIEANENINDLFKAARSSRKRGVVNRLVPMDRQIFRWLEANDADKLDLAKDMTGEELKAAQWIQADYAKMRDQLLRGEVLKRGMKNYVTHIRRGFLEAWREGGESVAGMVDNSKSGFFKRFGSGFKAAGKELFDKYKQDEAVMNILDSRTGKVLPLNKFFQFSMKRSGQLVPSKNVARAYMSYKKTFERKRALDSIMPKYQAIIDAITPMKETQGGLVYDDRLNTFFKEFMNTQKGRVANRAFLTPGGLPDWAVRSVSSLLRMLYLGFALPVGLTSQAGAQSVVFKGLGTIKYQRGVRRAATKKGRKIAKKYNALVGEKALQPMFDAASTLGERADTLAYGLFANAGRNANVAYMLGEMTKDEFAKGIISPDRLAFIKRDIAKQLPVSGIGSKSIMGATALGGVFKQFKGWALPQISTTLSQINSLAKRKVPLNSVEGREILRTVVLSSAIVIGSYEFMQSHKSRKDRNFAEEIAYKGARDSLSALGSLDPTVYTSEPAAFAFIGKLAIALKQIVLAEKTASGDWKALNTLASALTPSMVRQFSSADDKSTSSVMDDIPASSSSGSGLDELDGLNDLEANLDDLENLDGVDDLEKAMKELDNL